jgi:hypothetical protein
MVVAINFACHPERSEGSAVAANCRSLAALGMTIYKEKVRPAPTFTTLLDRRERLIKVVKNIFHILDAD